jgi:hypothetical protein
VGFDSESTIVCFSERDEIDKRARMPMAIAMTSTNIDSCRRPRQKQRGRMKGIKAINTDCSVDSRETSRFSEANQFLHGFALRDPHLGKTVCSWDAIPEQLDQLVSQLSSEVLGRSIPTLEQNNQETRPGPTHMVYEPVHMVCVRLKQTDDRFGGDHSMGRAFVLCCHFLMHKLRTFVMPR